MPLVFLMYYWCFWFACFYTFIFYLLPNISTSYWVVFGPCKDLLNVNKDEDEGGVFNFMPGHFMMGKEFRCPLNRRWVGHNWEKRKIFCCSWELNTGSCIPWPSQCTNYAISVPSHFVLRIYIIRRDGREGERLWDIWILVFTAEFEVLTKCLL